MCSLTLWKLASVLDSWAPKKKNLRQFPAVSCHVTPPPPKPHFSAGNCIFLQESAFFLQENVHFFCRKTHLSAVRSPSAQESWMVVCFWMTLVGGHLVHESCSHICFTGNRLCSACRPPPCASSLYIAGEPAGWPICMQRHWANTWSAAWHERILLSRRALPGLFEGAKFLIRKDPEGKNAKGKNFWKLRGRKMFAEDISEDFSDLTFTGFYSISGYLRNLRGRLFSSEKFSEVFTLWVFTLKPFPENCWKNTGNCVDQSRKCAINHSWTKKFRGAVRVRVQGVTSDYLC